MRTGNWSLLEPRGIWLRALRDDVLRELGTGPLLNRELSASGGLHDDVPRELGTGPLLILEVSGSGVFVTTYHENWELVLS